MIATNRIVATYSAGRGFPVGFFTGYEDGQGGFALEHVVSFNPRGLLTLLRWGLQEAWARDFQYVTFFVPKDFPLARQLALVGLRLGFQEYGHDPTREYFVCHRPQDAPARGGEGAHVVRHVPSGVEDEVRALLHDGAHDLGSGG